MAGHLSDEELRRMKRFANTPKYARKPEQLLPDDGE